MPINCVECDGLRQDEKWGPIAACKMARRLCGYQMYIPLTHCQGCNATDDGASHVSKVILSCLRLRIARDWNKPTTTDCGGPGLTLDEAVAQMKERNATLTQAALTEAVARGAMPESVALALATKYFPET